MRRNALIAALLATTCTAHAATLIVDSASDTSAATHCTLRDALIAANTDTARYGCGAGEAGRDAIHFAIPGDELHVISPLAPLPPITSPVDIDGYTQPGSVANDDPPNDDNAAWSTNAVVRVELAGSQIANAASPALHFATGSDDGRVAGLAVHSFANEAIRIEAPRVAVLGNFIGTDAEGLIAKPNGSVAVRVVASGDDARIGSGDAVDVNLVAGASAAIVASGDAVTIENNLVGTDRHGAPIGATAHGVYLTAAAEAVVRGNRIHAAARGVTLAPPFATDARIAFNTLLGYDIAGLAIGAPIAIGNVAFGNRFETHAGGYAIDLGGDGPDANDAGDGDAGPNGRLNHPVLAGARYDGGELSIDFALDVPITAGDDLVVLPEARAYTLDAYVADACHATLRGPAIGGRWIGTYVGFAHDAIATATFDGGEVGNAAYASATVIGPDGTSEFSNCIAITR